MTVPLLRPLRSGQRDLFLAGLIVGSLCGGLLAADPLKAIPGNAAGVIIFRDIEATIPRLNALARKIAPDSEGLCLDDFESYLNLESGTIDPGKPVVMILARPSFGASTSVIAFVPKDEDEFRDMAGEPGPQSYEGPEGNGFATINDGVGMVSCSRKTLRLARSGASRRPFIKSLDKEELSQFDDSDVFVHLPLTKWREQKIAPMLMVASSLMKLSLAQAEAANNEATAALIDVFANGARQVVDEMESVTFSIQLDKEVIRIVHHHDFHPNAAVSNYLNQVERPEGELFAQLPDSRFIFAFTANWRNSRESAISARVSEAVCSLKPAAGKAEQDARDQLIKTVKDYYAQTQGVFLSIGPSEGGAFPMIMQGGYVMEDAALGFEQFKVIHDKAGEALSSFMPGCGMSGALQLLKKDGQEYMEVPLGNGALPVEYRRQVEAFYGVGARFQKTVADKHHLVYVLSRPPLSVSDVIQARDSQRTLAKNKSVQKMLSNLPAEKANLLVIMNLGQIIESLPEMGAMAHVGLPGQTSKTAAVTRAKRVEEPEKIGPLLGWALEVGKNSMTGQFVIGNNDAVQFVKSAKAMARPRPLRTIKVRRAETPIPPQPPQE